MLFLKRHFAEIVYIKKSPLQLCVPSQNVTPMRFDTIKLITDKRCKQNSKKNSYLLVTNLAVCSYSIEMKFDYDL